MTHFTWLLVALPLAGAAILLFGGRRTDPWGHLLGCATAVAAFGVGVTLLADLLGRHGADQVELWQLENLGKRPELSSARPASRSLLSLRMIAVLIT